MKAVIFLISTYSISTIKSKAKLKPALRSICTFIFSIFCLSVFSLSSFNVYSSEDKPIRLAVAANFKHTLEKLVKAYQVHRRNQEQVTEQHAKSDIEFTISSASSGVLYNQILRGAPFDLFFSADALRPEKLFSEGVGEQQAVYALGKIVLWYPSGNKLNVIDALKQIQFAGESGALKFAIANPKLAPYGEASEQILRRLQYSESFSRFLVMGNNVSHVEQFVFTGAAQAGFIAASQVKANSNTIIVDSRLYDPIEQKMLLLKPNKHAVAFFEFVQSRKGRQIVADNGYASPEMSKGKVNEMNGKGR